MKGDPCWLVWLDTFGGDGDKLLDIFLNQDEAIEFRDQYGPTEAFIERRELK